MTLVMAAVHGKADIAIVGFNVAFDTRTGHRLPAHSIQFCIIHPFEPIFKFADKVCIVLAHGSRRGPNAHEVRF